MGDGTVLDVGFFSPFILGLGIPGLLVVLLQRIMVVVLTGDYGLLIWSSHEKLLFVCYVPYLLSRSAVWWPTETGLCQPRLQVDVPFFF